MSRSLRLRAVVNWAGDFMRPFPPDFIENAKVSDFSSVSRYLFETAYTKRGHYDCLDNYSR